MENSCLKRGDLVLIRKPSEARLLQWEAEAEDSWAPGMDRHVGKVCVVRYLDKTHDACVDNIVGLEDIGFNWPPCALIKIDNRSSTKMLFPLKVIKGGKEDGS